MGRVEFNSSTPYIVQWNSGKDSTQIHGIPNFFSKANLGKTSQISSAAGILSVAAVAATILRIFSRRRSKTPHGWDDFCAIFAAIILLINEDIFMAVYYIGRDAFTFIGRPNKNEEDARLASIVTGLKLSLVFEILYLATIFLIKASMLFLYDRFARQTRGITLYLRITQGLCLLTFAACILSLFLSCIPVNLFWSLQVDSEKCTRRILLTYTSGVSNIVTNTLVLAVPVPLLLRATLNRRQKMGLAILYFFGAFVIIASALRFVTQILNVGVPQAMAWSQLEVSLALILASAPMAIKLLLIPLEDPKIIRATAERDRKAAASNSRDLEKGDILARLRNEKEKDLYSASSSTTSSPVTYQARTQRSVSFALDSTEKTHSSENYRREIPDYTKMKLVKEEVNGQNVWEVRPISPTVAVEKITPNYSRAL